MVECKICSKVFDTNYGLSSHIVQKHKIKLVDYYCTYVNQNKGICKICGNETKFKSITSGFRTYCSRKCVRQDKEINDKIKETCIDKYNVTNPLNKKDAQEKANKTKLEKFGTTNVLSLPEIRRKIKQTTLERYGAENVFASDYGKQKIKETLLDKYGVENAMQVKEIKEKVNSIETREKIYKTKRKNGTFNTSKPEETIYQELITIFGSNQVYRNYRDKRYPFHCDFYIKCLDLYIECNFIWTHNSHWFNKKDEDDINTLILWENKSKNSDYYKNAVNTWTIRDTNKRNTAKKNKLNYVVFWSYNDFLDWVALKYPIGHDYIKEYTWKRRELL